MADFELQRHDRAHFFKYTSAATAKLIIDSRKLRSSSPLLFNDPFDHQTGFTFPFTGEELAQAVVDARKRVVYGDAPFDPPYRTTYGDLLRVARANRDRLPYQEGDFDQAAREMAANFQPLTQKLNTEITEQLTRSRVFCLTERNDNLLMWAHYADSHHGVAFKFRRLEQLDHRFLVAQPVRYSDEPVSFPNLPDYVDHLLGLTRYDLISLVWEIAFRKHSDWRYEQEWRVHIALRADEDPGPGYSDDAEPPELFEAIFLGCKMESQAATELVALIREKLPQTAIFQARKRAIGIGLEFDLLPV